MLTGDSALFLNQILLGITISLFLWTFTSHAVKRMIKRKIPKNEVLDAIRNPDKIYKRHGKHFLQKMIDVGTFEICCIKTERVIKIITIYWI